MTDLLQIAAAGLQLGREYELTLVDSLVNPTASRVALTTANPSGAAIAQPLALSEQSYGQRGVEPVNNLSNAIWL